MTLFRVTGQHLAGQRFEHDAFGAVEFAVVIRDAGMAGLFLALDTGPEHLAHQFVALVPVN